MTKDEKQVVYALLVLVSVVFISTVICYLFVTWEAPNNTEIRTLLLFTLSAIIGVKGYKRNET